ncbi:efflux RND transporter permease subunit [Proteobacteria bacterium 005FR1]|nr:efflux RND transporter permease subunit [Proteobacteria bacterium 005FR1]
MQLLKASHRNPVATIVVFVIVGILGIGAMFSLPVQLTPDIDHPKISVINYWRAAAPAELESELVEPQENALKDIVGLREISSSIRSGMSISMLTFEVGTNMQQAFVNVINALNQTPQRPREASEPIVSLGGLEQGLATLLIRKADGSTDHDFTAHQELFEQSVAPRLRSIGGITKVELNSFRDSQLRITFDPYRMAALGLTLDQLMTRIARSADVSGGFAAVGRREYTVRFRGQYSPDDYADMIVAYNDGRPVHLGEVAEVSIGHEDMRAFAYRDGAPAFYIQVFAGNNANTVDIMGEINRQVAAINEELLEPRGMAMDLSFDPSVHIQRAVDLVQSNLGLGIVLAMALLYLMLRGLRPTLLIAMTIPVSLLAALMVLDMLGRSLNIISLAGLAFAVGLVLDAAIVVQENIIRLVQQGEALKRAAIRGTAEVMPALFASTITTVAIFTPILFMQGVEGQLFYDLAVSMAVAVCASMITALFLLPVVASLTLGGRRTESDVPRFWHRLARRYRNLTASPRRAALWLLILGPGALAVIALLTPRADFLPEAKWDGIMAVFSVPPGANFEVLEKELGQTLVRRLEPYLAGDKQPAIKAYNIAMSAGGKLLFVYPQNPRQTQRLLERLRGEILADLPDTSSFAFQASLLSATPGGSRSVYLHFNGELDATSRLVAGRTVDRIRDDIPGANVRTLPGLHDARPQLTLHPANQQLAQAGLERGQVADMIRAVTSGVFAGEYFDGNRRMDIIVRSEPWRSPEHLQAMPMSTPLAGVQTMGQLTHSERGTAPTELRRFNGSRALTLAITPPANLTLQDTIDTLRPIMENAAREAGPGVYLTLSGGSDDLAQTISTMSWNFAFAVLILFLLMTALFRSAVDSLLVLASMPMALAGGVLGLKALNIFTYQSLDLLTMIGFVILMGLVVNNAILLIDRSRRGQRAGLSLEEAIQSAIETRVRPIYMSTLTSVVGMLPLVLVPGVGSEIYRGLAVVIVGGMLVSTLFTVIFMASALRLTASIKHRSRLALRTALTSVQS